MLRRLFRKNEVVETETPVVVEKEETEVSRFTSEDFERISKVNEETRLESFKNYVKSEKPYLLKLNIDSVIGDFLDSLGCSLKDSTKVNATNYLETFKNTKLKEPSLRKQLSLIRSYLKWLHDAGNLEFFILRKFLVTLTNGNLSKILGSMPQVKKRKVLATETFEPSISTETKSLSFTYVVGKIENQNFRVIGVSHNKDTSNNIAKPGNVILLVPEGVEFLFDVTNLANSKNILNVTFKEA